MAYTFNPTASGTIEVYQDGQRISTTTAQNAAMNYGYQTNAAPQTAVSQLNQPGQSMAVGATNTNPQPSQPVQTVQPSQQYNPIPQQTQALQQAQTPTPTAPTPTPQTQSQQGTPSPYTAPSFQMPTFTPPPAPSLSNTADQYLQQYLSSLNPTAEENALKSQSDALNSQLAGVNASRDLGIQGVNEQPIATKFLTGQGAAITNRAAVQAGALGAQALPLQARLAAEQAKRQSAMDVTKGALDYAKQRDSSQNQYAQQNYENQLAQQQYAQQLAQQQYINQQNANKSVELSAGSTYYNPSSGSAYTAPTTAATNATAGTGGTTTTPSGLTTGKTFVSGTLKYAPDAYQADTQKLVASRGTDGYVDPAIYVNLYKAWIGAGGTQSDFLSVYPIKDFVNPAPQSDPAVYSVVKLLRGDKAPTTTTARSV